MQVPRKEMFGVWYWMLAGHIASTHGAERDCSMVIKASESTPTEPLFYSEFHLLKQLFSSPGSHIRYLACQIFTLNIYLTVIYITVAKLQLRSSNKIILWFVVTPT